MHLTWHAFMVTSSGNMSRLAKISHSIPWFSAWWMHQVVAQYLPRLGITSTKYRFERVASLQPFCSMWWIVRVAEVFIRSRKSNEYFAFSNSVIYFNHLSGWNFDTRHEGRRCRGRGHSRGDFFSTFLTNMGQYLNNIWYTCSDLASDCINYCVLFSSRRFPTFFWSLFLKVSEDVFPLR